MYTSMGYGVYIFFASCLVCASIYAYFFIHETKGLRMDQMDHLFGFERSVDNLASQYAKGTGADEDSMHGVEKDLQVDVTRKEVV